MSQNEPRKMSVTDGLSVAGEAPSPSETTDDLPRSRPAEARGPLGLPRTYWLLWGGMLLNRLGGSVFFLLPIYLTHQRGLAPELAGLVVSLYGAGGMIAGPVGGALADRAGRRTTLLVGTVCAGSLMLALGFARTIGAIVLLAPLLGFCTDLCRPPLQAAVADMVAPADRARAYGLLSWAINLGFAGAASFGGALAEHSFGLLFVIDALTTFGYGAIVFVGVPETRPGLPVAGRRVYGVRALIEPFRDGRFMGFLAIQFLLLLGFAQVLAALPLDMRGHGLSTAEIGWLLALNGVVIVVAQPIALRLMRGRSHVHWLIAGALLTGFGLGATALARGALGYALALVVWTLGEIGFSTGAPTLIAERAPAERRGAYQGTYQLVWGLATMMAPVIGSFVLSRVGPRALWLGCLIACVGSAALHLTVTARQPR